MDSVVADAFRTVGQDFDEANAPADGESQVLQPLILKSGFVTGSGA